MMRKASRTVLDFVHIRWAFALQPQQYLEVFGDSTAMKLLVWKWEWKYGARHPA